MAKYDTYRIEQANGEAFTVKVPVFFSPVDVIKRLSHSEVALRVPKGRRCQIKVGECTSRWADGPCWVLGYDGSEWTRAQTAQPFAA